MAKKETKGCSKCGKIKELTQFFVSYSPLHFDNRVSICKDCCYEYEYSDMNSFISLCRTLDKPFRMDIYEKAGAKSKDNPIGVYMRMIILNDKLSTYKDSDGVANEAKTITRMNTEILRKQEELKELEEKTKNIRKEETENISDELIKRWGRGYTEDEYIMFEEKYKLIESSYPLRSTMHLEALKTYVRYAVKAELSTANNDISSAKEWGRLANEASKKAKIDPSQLSSSDLTQGLDSFSELVRQVEKAVDIIPILPQFISKPKDKVDFTIFCYVNYERDLRGMPLVEYKDVYDFYNKMVEDYVKASPDDYAFLKDTDESLPL